MDVVLLVLVVTGARTEVMELMEVMVTLAVEDPDKTSQLSTCKSSASLLGAEGSIRRVTVTMVAEVEVSWWKVLVPRTQSMLDRVTAEEAHLAETLGPALSFWR